MTKARKRQAYLNTRIGRRMFILFVACAMIPLAGISWLCYRQASEHLIRNAFVSLRSECRSAGQSILERLQSHDDNLQNLALSLEDDPEDSVFEVPQSWRARLAERFSDLWVTDEKGGLQHTLVGKATNIALEQGEEEHLSGGNTLVVFRNEGPKTMGLMVLRLRGSSTGKRNLVARIPHAAIWNHDYLEIPGQVLVVTDAKGRVLLSNLASKTRAGDFASGALARAPTDKALEIELASETYVAAAWDLYAQGLYRIDWRIMRFQPKADLLVFTDQLKQNLLLVGVLALVVIGAFTVSQIRRVLGPVQELSGAAASIADRDYSVRVELSKDDELGQLASGFNHMVERIEGHITATEELNEIGISLTSEPDLDRLLSKIIVGARRVVKADRCRIWLLEGEVLLASSGDSREDESPSSLQLFDGRGRPVMEHPVVAAYHSGRTFCVDQQWMQEASTEGETGKGGRISINAPLLNHEGQIIGVLQLSRLVPTGGDNPAAFDADDQHMVASIVSQAAVAISKNQLISEYKELFEALIEMLAGAIDEKSPYTGAHCRRVPDLAIRFAEAVQRTSSGPLSEFELTEAERYEFEIAALLHDCGKVTTPVHVIDKATKLETIFDRMSLVETRFELLKRDEEIRALRQAIEQGNGDTTVLEEQIADARERIEENLAFLRRSNTGSEFMADEDRQRVHDVAYGATWTDGAGEEQNALTENEIENLTIPAGTLTSAERQVIADHMAVTIRMLKKLPFPDSLRRVPEIAGAHHERMDGKGYPQGLKGDEMLVQGRMLAIVDVFEALTARDRPYKKGKTLSEALGIMDNMSRTGHLDPDLFAVFCAERVFLDYARECLGEYQMDITEYVPKVLEKQPVAQSP